ncbi:alpha/beta hydrolase [Ligilactobacillus apodemi]|uniref:Lipase esterase n=1 Tax=Ligilactobacillus apodemi DSM 16634 = JCM 16172 TaxID=1423724 RepID=A0A0R1TXX0_9LACO|nr:alpha/beta hydrolase [Ligilactobacillus apodemi]KRL83413.1 Lipase esterase [Ligilactobacillus apodemi DSM 16634 = JCM 16172]MCR1901568.1 alpha/beta hydrolase [Ligilactobacillus apodemi]
MKDKNYIEPEFYTPADFPTSKARSKYEVNKIKADLTWRYPFIKMDEVYAHKDGMDLHVHVIMPTPNNLFPSDKTFPLVVYVQGSAFQKQNMGDHLAHLAEFAMRGYVIAMVEYRYAPKATFPKQILDVKTAIRFLYQNKEKYHIQADQAILWGDSSGGHTVVMTAVTEHNQNFSEEDNETQPLNIIGVIDLYGPTVIRRMNYQPSIGDHTSANGYEGQLFGRIPVLENLDLVEKANPLNYITPESALPPFLIMHGDKDRLVPFEQSVLLYDALKDAGKDATFYQLEGADHAMDAFFTKQMTNIVADFMQKCLKKSK